MAELLNRLRLTVRSLGNDGALANLRSDMTAARHAHEEIDRLEERLAATPMVAEGRRAA